jgi:hypothetical protein
VPKRRANECRVLQNLTNNTWTGDLQGALPAGVLAKFLNLWDILPRVVLQPRSENKHIWQFTASGVYTAKPAMMVSFKAPFNLVHGSVFGEPGLLTNAVFSCGWSCTESAGLQIVLLGWVLPHKKCLLCDQEEETISHLLVTCVFSRAFWFELFQKFGLQNLAPHLAGPSLDLVRLLLFRIGRRLIP